MARSRLGARARAAFVIALPLATLMLLAPSQWLAELLPTLDVGPESEMPWTQHLDKIGHAALFLVLTWLAGFGYGRWLVVCSALIVYGAGIELLQDFVPGRGSEWLDLVADASGVTAAAMLSRVTMRFLAPTDPELRLAQSAMSKRRQQ